jgi:hypothetical protein
MLSVTIVGGIAVWAYVNTTSATVTESYGQEVVSDINNLNEDFIITYIGLNSTTDTVTIWMYNNGNMDTNITQVLIWSLSNSTADSTATSLSLDKGETGTVTVSHSLVTDETYYVKAVATYGSSDETYQKAT